jgi:tetraacyldisaccharide 4'-kinase
MGKGSMLIFEAMKLLRIVLIPFSWLYGFVLMVRHWLFDNGIFKSTQFNTPVICVGNLSMGGTGKTPFTIYLAKVLSKTNKVAILSRGYKRTSKGFIRLTQTSTAAEVGDEPLLMFNQLNNVDVVVDANRTNAIHQLEKAHRPNVILLDDGYQHRKVKAHLNILLTDFNHVYPNDRLFPAGNLRDLPQRANAANIIIITKCPPNADFNLLRSLIRPHQNQHLFFTQLTHRTLRPLGNREALPLKSLQGSQIVLFTGIAQPNYLVDFLQNQGANVHHLKFPDHHTYTVADIQKVTKIFDTFDAALKMVITTEKDAIKLTNSTFLEQFKNLPVYVIDAQIEFIKEEDLFLNIVAQYA